jgi:rhodanese-related sulfurtransferase
MANEISTEELKEKIDSGADFHLVETLLPEEFEKWHLPGAENIHFKKMGEAAKERFSTEDEIVVYCHDEDCNASKLAVKKLESMGYANVLHYGGGKRAWREAGYPTEGTPPQG